MLKQVGLYLGMIPVSASEFSKKCFHIYIKQALKTSVKILGGGTLLYKVSRDKRSLNGKEHAASKGMVFEPFWVRNGVCVAL